MSKPAITPEQWRILVGRAKPPYDDATFHGNMALENYNLSDGHPGKFTQADVDVVNAALEWYEQDAKYYGARDEDREQLEQLAAKIRALLPVALVTTTTTAARPPEARGE